MKRKPRELLPTDTNLTIRLDVIAYLKFAVQYTRKYFPIWMWDFKCIYIGKRVFALVVVEDANRVHDTVLETSHKVLFNPLL